MRFFTIYIIMLLTATAATAQDIVIERGRQPFECWHKGIGRCRTYDVRCADVPPEFDGCKIAFVTDTHYKSRFDERTLVALSNVLNEVQADIVLLGGDYQEGCEYVEPLFDAISQYKAPLGAFGVMGNNDYERCTDLIRESMARHGITLLESKLDTIRKGSAQILIAGAKNTFGKRETIPSPTTQCKPDDFVILVTHTPDYAEDVDISQTDIALAGHTHGGQVTLFGLYAPVTASHYGQKFLKGLCHNSAGIPVIVSTGIGTSRKNVRFFAKSEIIVLTLHTK